LWCFCTPITEKRQKTQETNPQGIRELVNSQVADITANTLGRGASFFCRRPLVACYPPTPRAPQVLPVFVREPRPFSHPPQQVHGRPWALLPSPRKAPSAATNWHSNGHALVAIPAPSFGAAIPQGVIHVSS
jgi:hypothetical protein